MTRSLLAELTKKYRIPRKELTEKEQIFILVDRKIIADEDYLFDEAGILVEKSDVSEKAVERVKKALDIHAEAASFQQQKGDVMKKKYDPEAELKKALNGHIATPEDLGDGDEVKKRFFGLKIRLEEVIASEMEDIDGFEIIVHQKSVKFRPSKVPVSKNSVLYEHFKSGALKAYLLKEPDHTSRMAIIKAASVGVYNGSMAKYGKPKFLVAKNIHKDEVVFAGAFREVFNEILGDEISRYEMLKPWGPVCTPYRFKLMTSSKPEYEFVIIDTKAIDGVLTHDGEGFLKARVRYKEYLNSWKRKNNFKAKWKRIDMAQCRLSGKGNPVLKLNVMIHEEECNMFIKQYGFDPEKYDGAIEISNLKTNPQGYKHGDTLKVKASDFRFSVILGEKAGSSVGVQLVCANSNPEMPRALLKEKGMLDKAQIMKDAMLGKASAVKSVLDVDEEKTMQDAYIMGVRALGYAIPKNGDWYIPRWESMFNSMAARLESFYKEHVVKVRTSDYLFYARSKVYNILDKMEAEHIAKTGKYINYVILPSNDKLLQDVTDHKYLNTFRSPVVAIGNIQEAIPVTTKNISISKAEMDKHGLKVSTILAKDGGYYVTNGTKSAIMISEAYAKEKFEDFDGDFEMIALSNHAAFPVVRTTLPEIKKEKKEPKTLSDPEFVNYLLDVYASKIEAQLNTGIIDLLVRQIYTERMEADNPVTIGEGQLMGQIREAAIQSAKRKEGKTVQLGEDDAVQSLVKQFGQNGEIKKGLAVSMSHRLLTKSAGLAAFDDEGYALRNPRNILRERVKLFNLIAPHKNDPYIDLWMLMKGAKNEPCQEDSLYWKHQFEELWAKKEILIGKKVLSTTAQKLENFAFMITNGSRDFDGYRRLAGAYANIGNTKEKNKAFDSLTTMIAGKKDKEGNIIENGMLLDFIIETFGLDKERQEIGWRLLAMALGKISFGMSRNGAGMPGYCYWFLPKDTLVWIAQIVHPENPFLVGIE